MEKENKLLSIYQMTVDDISRTINWQWTIFYHIIVGQIAIITSYRLVKSSLIVFVIFLVLSGFVGVLTQCYYFRNLERFRARIKLIRNDLGDLNKYFETKIKSDITCYLIITIIVVTILTIWVINVLKP